MYKYRATTAGFALLAGLLMVACGGGAGSEPLASPGASAGTVTDKVEGVDVYCVDLIAGQNTVAGDVCMTLVDEFDLSITFTTTGGWELDEAHVYVGTREGMPQTRHGNPKIGNFPYASGDISGSTTYEFTIALADVQIGTDEAGNAVYADCDSALFVAAHAALSKDNGDGTYDTETGWGEGDPLVDRGSWAMGFDIQLECDTDPEPKEGCETAFAYGGDGATCFLDIDEDADDKGDFNRWGWTQAISPGDSVTWDVWAAAGQCDTSKGTKVGTLTVGYDTDGTLTATYTINSPYTMTESHFYAGSAILPTDNGDFTVAPGQYPQVVDNLGEDGVSTYTHTVENLTGDVYVVAHSVVCGF